MKRLKRIITVAITFFTIIIMFSDCSKSNVRAIGLERAPVRVAVFLYNSGDDFISLIHKNLEEIQKQNQDKVQYTFYDGQSNQDIQNEQINKVLGEGTDLILLNIVNIGDAQNAINTIKETNIPVILFNREPLSPAPIQSYGKAIYIGTDAKQTGILQGEMIINVWNTSKQFIDKNSDDIMQYVMLEGQVNNIEAIGRTQYSVSTIQDADIQTQELKLLVCNWFEDQAYDSMKTLILKYGNQIEVIISNNDAMALGAIKALQEAGYNLGDKSRTIPVVGVDIIPQAREFIEKGYMLGSVYQDPKTYADALYICGMNLIQGKSPIEGTQYKFDDTQVAIRLPQTEYLYNNIFNK